MRLIYLHQYFKTPEEGGAIRSYYIGRALAARGHEVQMICGWNGDREKVETIAGMQVHYLPVPYHNQMGFWRRIGAFFQFLKLARQKLKQLQPARLVYATSTPLSIGLLALYGRWRYKLPYIFEVRDLWPEAPMQLGAVRNPFLIAILRRLEKTIYQQAAAIVALSPGIAQGIRATYPGAAVHLAPNMADCQFFTPGPKPAALLQKWGLMQGFVISYTGAAGKANRLEYLLAAARACQEAALPVLFLVAAQGAALPHLRELATGLQNLRFLPYGSKEEVREYLSVSDAVYVSFGPQPVLQSCSPNKLFDALAAGKLCIVNTPGWLKTLVEEQGCGFYANPEEPLSFVEALLPYLQQRERLQQAQVHARMAAEQLFSRENITAQLVQLVENTAAH